MGFSDLPVVEKTDTYLDSAFKKARDATRSHNLATHEKDALNREKTLALIKVRTVRDTLVKQLQILIDKYPNFDNLHEFYAQLLRATLNYKKIKKTLGSISWAQQQVRTFASNYMRKIKGGQDPKLIKELTNQYYGRISSIYKQIDKELQYLHLARQAMREYPTIKEGCLDVCIAGFPNVGKSTLLSQLTSAKPEISNYAFTTKKLNLGYTTLDAVKLQFIDTPGTLNRPETMNPVELQAHLALRYVAQFIIYVFDLTESAYSLKDQLKLFKNMKQYDKTMLCYIAKTDLVSSGDIEKFKEKFENKKIPLLTNREDIPRLLLELYKKELL